MNTKTNEEIVDASFETDQNPNTCEVRGVIPRTDAQDAAIWMERALSEERHKNALAQLVVDGHSRIETLVLQRVELEAALREERADHQKTEKGCETIIDGFHKRMEEIAAVIRNIAGEENWSNNIYTGPSDIKSELLELANRLHKPPKSTPPF